MIFYSLCCVCIFNMRAAVLLAFFISAVVSDETPKWGPQYTAKGTLFIPYAEIQEPFYAWYDEKAGSSRIDYYGGMVKTYQLAGKYNYGTSLKIAPVTTEDEQNADTCLQVNGTTEQHITIQSILPDLTDFVRIGEEEILGLNCDKWSLIDTVGHKTNKYTMWIRYKKSHKHSASRVSVPVRYEMKGYNSLLGSHYDHYYLEYDSFSTDDIDDEVFEVDADKPCVSFPGPGSGTIATFNPMREFIHPHNTQHVDDEFQRFLNKHGLTYTEEAEHHKRKEVFRQNLRYIYSKNRASLGFTLTVNHLADRTDSEIRALRGNRPSFGYNGGLPFPHDISKESQDLPEQFDWRIYGAVTPVKDQSVCGSCWSFGTIGAIEGAYFLKNGGNLVRLSQQALIDCSWGYGNNGCDGGEDFRAYQWMMKHGGIPTEEDYGGYLGQDGYCHINNVTLVAPITGYVNVTSNDPKAFKIALLKHGPISVAIDASHKTFSFYSNGVYYEPKCGNKPDELDHAVLAVGYGTINNEPYWLVKNSWSNFWGNDGYILMSARNNNCGVMTDPTYVNM